MAFGREKCMKKERNSSIEMLRILAMLGIVIMHTNGAVMEHGAGTGFAWTQIENGIFNVGVSIFVLISGYFGIRRSTQKLIELESTFITNCSIILFLLFIFMSFTSFSFFLFMIK